MSTTHAVSPKTGERANPGRRALPRAAHILLEDMLDATPRSGSTFRIADLPPGLTIVEVPQEEWLWPVVETLHNEIIGARERCVINGAHSVPDIFNISAGEELSMLLNEPDDDDTTRRPVVILVPGDHGPAPFSPKERVNIGVGTNSQASLTKGAAAMIARGLPVLVFTSRATRLSPPLHLAADQILNVPPFRGEQVARLFGHEPGRDDIASTMPQGPVTPDQLQLAWRRGDSRTSYLARLRRHLGNSSAARPADGPDRPGFPKRLEEVRGMDRAVEWARHLVADLALYRRGALPWDDVDRGAVLAGPPGVGKTRFVSLVAAEAGIPVVLSSVAHWMRREGNDISAQDRIAETFRQARAAAPCILLIDELDAIWTREGKSDQNTSYFTSLITALLGELDGSLPRDGVVVIGTTNRPDSIDRALRRPGRLDVTIEIPAPDYDALRMIIDAYTEGVCTPAELDDAALRAFLRRATGADVERWARGMRRRARRETRPPRFDDLIAAMTGGEEAGHDRVRGRS